MEYEESFIKCYARKGSDSEILGYQRRVLLSSTGKLGGCPEDTDPPAVVVLWKKDFLDLKRELTLYQEAETRTKKELQELTESNHQLKQGIDDKELEIRKAIAFIGVAWAGIQDLKKRSWWERLRGGIPESLIQLQKPPSEIFPLPEDLILLEDETTPGEVE